MPEQVQMIMKKFASQVKQILGETLCRIIIYGSYARGDFTENSDVDVMVLTTLTDEESSSISYQLYDLAFDYQMEYGIDISVMVKNEAQFNYWLGALPFYDNVNREGIVING